MAIREMLDHYFTLLDAQAAWKNRSQFSARAELREVEQRLRSWVSSEASFDSLTGRLEKLQKRVEANNESATVTSLRAEVAALQEQLRADGEERKRRYDQWDEEVRLVRRDCNLAVIEARRQRDDASSTLNSTTTWFNTKLEEARDAFKRTEAVLGLDPAIDSTFEKRCRRVVSECDEARQELNGAVAIGDRQRERAKQAERERDEFRTQLVAEKVARERAEHEIMLEKTHWPQSVGRLEEALSTFPAGRSFLAQWTKADVDLAAEKVARELADKRADACEAGFAELVRTLPSLSSHLGGKATVFVSVSDAAERILARIATLEADLYLMWRNSWVCAWAGIGHVVAANACAREQEERADKAEAEVTTLREARERDPSIAFTQDEFHSISERARHDGDHLVEQLANICLSLEPHIERQAAKLAALVDSVKVLLAISPREPETIGGRMAQKVKDLVDGLSRADLDPELLEINWKTSAPLKLTFKTNWAMQLLAAGLAKTLRKEDGTYWNNVTCTTHYQGEDLSLELSRRSGKTCKQQLTEAEARVAILESDLVAANALAREQDERAGTIEAGTLAMAQEAVVARIRHGRDEYSAIGDDRGVNIADYYLVAIRALFLKLPGVPVLIRLRAAEQERDQLRKQCVVKDRALVVARAVIKLADEAPEAFDTAQADVTLKQIHEALNVGQKENE